MTQKEQTRLQVLNSLLAGHMMIERAATLMGVSTRHTEYESAGVCDLDSLFALYVDTVDLARLSSGVAVSIQPPGDSFDVVESIYKYGDVCLVVQ